MVIPSGAPQSTLVQETWTWVISHRDLPLDLLFALFHLQLPPVGRWSAPTRVPHVVERLPVGSPKKPQRVLAQHRREANFEPPPTDAYSAELPRYAVRANSAIGAGATVARISVCTWRSTVGFDVPPPSSPHTTVISVSGSPCSTSTQASESIARSL